MNALNDSTNDGSSSKQSDLSQKEFDFIIAELVALSVPENSWAETGKPISSIDVWNQPILSALLAQKAAELHQRLAPNIAQQILLRVQQQVIALVTRTGPNQKLKNSVTEASKSNTLRVLKPQLLFPLPAQTFSVSAAIFSPDSKKILTTSFDKTAKVSDVMTGKLLFRLRSHQDLILCGAYSPDGKWIATGGADSKAQISDAHTGEWKFNLGDRQKSQSPKKKYNPINSHQHENEISKISYSPDSQFILTASKDHLAKLWSAKSGKLLFNLQGHSQEITDAVFSPDGKLVATASTDQTIRIWDPKTGQQLLVITPPDYAKGVRYVKFSPNSLSVATSAEMGGTKTVHLWDAYSGQLISQFEGHTLDVSDFAFSPDGKQLATGSSDRTLRLWETATGELLFEKKGHTFWINTVDFSPDGKYILTGDQDGIAKLWNAQSGEFIQDLADGRLALTQTRFSPNGLLAVTATVDGKSKVWRILAEMDPD